MLRRRLQVYAPRVLRPGDLGDDDNDGADYGADYGGGDGDGGYFSFVNGVNGLIKLVRGKMSERDARLVVQAIRKAKPRKKACEYCMAFRVGGGYLTRGYGKRCQCCGNHIDINLGELGHTFEKEVFQELVEEEKVREKSTGRVKVEIANVAPPVRPKAEVHVFEKAKEKKKKKPKEEEYEAYVPPPREEVRVVEEAKQQTKKDEVYAATYAIWKRAVKVFGWAFFLISSGSPHVRPMGRTCGEPDEIGLTPMGGGIERLAGTSGALTDGNARTS